MAMTLSPIERATLLWQINDCLWKEKLEPKVLLPLGKAGGVNTSGNWEHILSAAFGRALETFQAVQRLCDPKQPRQFWGDAFVLTRQHFETLLTMEWIAQDENVRSQMFLDELALTEAHVLDVLGDKAREVSEEKRYHIFNLRKEVERRHNILPGTLSLIPKVKAIVDQLATPLAHKYPNLKWEYEMYYRDVSGFAHSRAWGLTQSMSGSANETLSIESTPQTGGKALLWNGGWLLRLLRLFNGVFKIISDSEISNWQNEWAKASA